jgi:hypothetical protein
MRCLWLFAFALVFCSGCAALDDALKDARGDNMQMRSGFNGPNPDPDGSMLMKPSKMASRDQFAN